MIDFAFDALAPKDRGYPNLNPFRPHPFTPEWREFDQHWPNTVPLRLLLYMDHCSLPYRSWIADQAPPGSIYPIAFSWFDFEKDYVSLIPKNTLELIRHQKLNIMFYYHEGDNPLRIRQRLDQQCVDHDIDPDQTLFVGANSSSRSIANCCYFDDFECWLWALNKNQDGDICIDEPQYDFTVLSRINKTWRACIVNDLIADGSLTNSLWSYDTSLPLQDTLKDNPIQCQERWGEISDFLNRGPYRCDEFDHHQQNDHHVVNTELYHRSKFHIVLETHFDADQSGGTFLTEKTYKCIKYGQPFVIAGPPGSIDVLRQHGYRTFDHVIDHSYDTEQDNTRRWQMLRKEISRIKSQPQKIWAQCQEDFNHNRLVFSQRPQSAVNTLLEEIRCHW